MGRYFSALEKYPKPSDFLNIFVREVSSFTDRDLVIETNRKQI